MLKSAISYQLSAITLLILLQGCVSTSDFDTVKADINQLKKDTYDLKKDTAQLKKNQEAVTLQLSGAAKEDSFNALRESQTSLYSQVSEISKDLQVLQGRFDENKFSVDKTVNDNKIDLDLLHSQINSLEMRLREMNEKLSKLAEGSAQPSVQKPATEAEPQAEKVEPQAKPEDDPVKLYNSAYNDFRQKGYKDAREKFNTFVKKYPKNNLIGNVHFWIGESYFAEKDYENAILAYESLVKGYPHNEKVPPALLKQGLSFLELGDKQTSKIIFGKLIEKYPDSPEAAQAKKKRAEIDKKPAKKKGAR